MTELSKAEQGLIEQLAQREAELHERYYNRKYGYHRWDALPPVMQAEIYDNAKHFLNLLKQADYKSPEELKNWVSELESIEREFFNDKAWLPSIQQRLHALLAQMEVSNPN